ncbi:MAG: hypothetical protein JW885_03470 [Deltaproteobacteria bacterium]|nr:hypothetical protein [Candidatus Zymogenaceae bacterium]
MKPFRIFPLWRRIREGGLDLAADAMNRAGTKRVLLSPYDTCDHGLERFRKLLDADVTILEAGGRYRIE